MSPDLPTPARALAIAAHLASHLICTDGSKGSWDPAADTAALVVTRQAEQRAAAAALGATGTCVFLGWPDGELEAGLRQRWEVAYWIRRLRPDVVLGHDPWKRYRLHPDHRNAGLLAVEGIVAARDPHFFPEMQSAPHRPTTLLLWEADEVDHVEDVSGHGPAKVASLLEHRSQFHTTHGIDDPADEGQVERFRRRIEDELADMGRSADLAQGEAFKRIDRL